MSKVVTLKGTKVGQTRVFDEATGVSMPVTVIEVQTATVLRHKTLNKDGYEATVLATGESKRNRFNKPQQGIAKAYGLGKTFRSLFEIRGTLYDPQSTLSLSDFDQSLPLDVCGISKGKGFAGVVKRHNFATQDATHGNSLSHRAPGSIGSNQPGRVWRGQKMAGHMGHANVTLKRRTIVSLDTERALMLVKGPLPGPNGGELVLSQSIG